MLNIINSGGRSPTFGTLRLTSKELIKNDSELISTIETDKNYNNKLVGNAIYIESKHTDPATAREQEFAVMLHFHTLCEKLNIKGLRVDYLAPGSGAKETMEFADSATRGTA